jgi:hypothetical protein
VALTGSLGSIRDLSIDGGIRSSHAVFDICERRKSADVLTGTLAMDRETQADEIRLVRAAPDVVVGSVAAVAETGSLVAASAGGSQLPSYCGGARSGSPGRGRSYRT